MPLFKLTYLAIFSLVTLFVSVASLAVDSLSERQMQSHFVSPPEQLTDKISKKKKAKKDKCQQLKELMENNKPSKNSDRQRAELEYAECQEKTQNKDKKKTEGLTDLNGDGVIDEKDAQAYGNEKSAKLLASLMGGESLKDTNGDGVVDARDAQALLDNQNDKSPLLKLVASGKLTDINGDGSIDSNDVSALSGAQSVSLLSSLVGKASLSDINGDGSIGSADAPAHELYASHQNGFGVLASLLEGGLTDLNDDGNVNAADIELLEGGVGHGLLVGLLSSAGELTDLNGDGVINGQDADIEFDALGGSSGMLLAQMVTMGGLTDLNADGEINAADMSQLAEFGAADLLGDLLSGGLLSDANNDGVINQFDLMNLTDTVDLTLVGLTNDQALFLNGLDLGALKKALDGDGEEDEEGVIFSVADYIALYGAYDGDDLNLSGLLGLGEDFYSDGLMSALLDWQADQMTDTLFGADSIFAWLESLLMDGVGHANINELLGGDNENFGPKYRYIDYIYEPITDEHHLEITKISTGWRVIDVDASP